MGRGAAKARLDQGSFMKTFFVNLLILVLAIILGLFVAEFAVRALFPWYDPARQVCFYANSDGVFLGKPNDVIRQRTPKGDFDLFSKFNKNGFRDEKDLAASHKGDIFVLGDSFSFGWGVSDGERYSDQLARMIHRPVFNISIPGDLKDYQRLLAYARSRGAHISSLIIGVCMENDLLNYATNSAAASGGKAVIPKWSVDWRNFFKSHSAVYLAFSYELQKVPAFRRFFEQNGLARDVEGLTHKNVLDEQVLASSKNEIMKIVRSVDSAVVLIIPSRMLWSGEHQGTELAIHERLIARLQREGVKIVDMRPYFEKDGHPLDYYFKTDPHWNKEGHALAAQALADYFKVKQKP